MKGFIYVGKDFVDKKRGNYSMIKNKITKFSRTHSINVISLKFDRK